MRIAVTTFGSLSPLSISPMVVFPTPTSTASWRCESSNPSRSLLEESNGVVRHRYTPHSCHHTFATLLKDVPAPDKDKLRLIGHTSAEMLRHYQDVDVDSLRRITDAL